VPLAMRVLVIGDSLSDPSVGGGRYLSEALSSCPVRKVRNLARGGWMVNQMRRGLEREVAAGLGPATHAVVFGGVNDLYSDETAGRTPEKIIADLQAIYALASSLGARVIALTVAPWGGFGRYYNPRRAEATRRVNAWIQEQAASGRIAAVIDAHTLLACGDPERLCPEYEAPVRDGLHVGAKGQAVLGRALAAALGECR
jgi:lysophospholipase L1-like esterase